MKKSQTIVMIILGIIVIGFIIGLIIPARGMMCTEMACSCGNFLPEQPNPPEEYRERPCNSCTSSNPIFILGVINVVKSCNGKEIIMCDGSDNIGTKYDIDEDSCGYKIKFLGLY